MPTLVDKLNCLCSAFDEMYDINHGGCCFVCSIIARYLDKLGIEYNFIIFDRDERVENNVIYNVQNNCEEYEDDKVIGYLTCNHYCLEIINSDYIIGNGLINESIEDDSDYYKFIIPRVTHENIDYILDRGDWNRKYEGYKYDNIISNMIHELFKEYENYTKKQNTLFTMPEGDITFTSSFFQ